MKKLSRQFGLVVGALLVSSAVTCFAGLYGLHRLDGSLTAVISVDMPRLMTITDLRKRIRMMVVAEGDHLLEADPQKAAGIAKEIAKGRATVDELFVKYEPYLLPEDTAKLGALRADVADWGRIDTQVLALSTERRTAEATALSRTHSKAWEGIIKQLIDNADRHLAATAKASSVVSRTAQVTVVAVFALSALLGLIAGVLIYRAIRAMVSRILSLNEQVSAANDGLERTVEERTRTIRAILDHVSFGFFLVDRELRVTDGYTRSLSHLLGRERIAGEPVTDCLGFTGGNADHFTMCVSQIFDDLLPEELSCDQVPSRVVRDGRTLRIQVSAVRDEVGEVRQLLFGISDVTDLETAERSNRESQMLLRALKNPDPFRRFVSDLTERFGSAREAVQGADELRARRELHTIKGNASCYGLIELAGRVHAVEENEIIELPPVVDLEDEFSRFLQSHIDVLGIEPGKPEREVYRIDGDEVARMEAMLADADDLASLRRTLGARLDRLRWLAASRLLGPLDTQVASLGQRLGKDVALRVRGGDMSVLPAGVMPIISVLPHLVRNAIDHGIEAREARGGKPAQSTLEIAFDDDDRAWRISVTDDGRGIDVERLRAKAIDRGVIAAHDQLSHDQLCALIFQPRLSTADEVSDVSGRGEGMAAVADAVKRLDGRITVTSSAGIGTKIVIEVPKPRRQPSFAAA